MTRFRATTATVISFFITESPTVRGPVGDMKDERHMLSGEGMDASSPRFKSKRRLEGTDIFKCVEEKRGRTSQDRRNLSALVTCNLYTRRSSELEEASSELEEASLKIREASVFPDVSGPVTYTLSFVEIMGSLSKSRFQISKRHQLYPDVSASVIHTLNLAEITGNLSKISGEVEST
ncbi:hypothetical protein ACFXTI_038108 [Malus domestica]